MGDTKVINFTAAKKDLPSAATETSFEIKKKRPKFECRHGELVLNESTRLCECKWCGDKLDAFDVLLGYADSERITKRDIARYEAAKKEFDAIQAGWNLTIAEKRRIEKAMQNVRWNPI